MNYQRTFSMFAAGTALTTLFALTGCGGGGGTASVTPGGSTPGQSTMAVFVTDRFSDDFSQVFVTLRRIEIGDDTGFHTVFDDPNGTTINASALANAAQMLATTAVPAGNYTQFRVTFDDRLTLVPRGAGNGVTATVDDTVGEHANGEVTLAVPATTVATPGQPSNLVVDFDLANFELNGNRVRPHIQRADDDRFHNEDKRAELRGTISGLTPTGFTLTQPNGGTAPVGLTAGTVILSKGQGTNAALANGQRVEVKGSVDPATRIVTADTIKINDQDNSSGDTNQGTQGGAEGTIASVNADAKTFVLTLKDTDDFQPTGGSVTVRTDAGTVFGRRHHDSASLADVNAGASAEVQGTFDAASQTLTARRVEIR